MTQVGSGSGFGFITKPAGRVQVDLNLFTALIPPAPSRLELAWPSNNALVSESALGINLIQFGVESQPRG